jgi:hypothetical protein
MLYCVMLWYGMICHVMSCHVMHKECLKWMMIVLKIHVASLASLSSLTGCLDM